MRPRCQVRLLGRFEVALDGRPVSTDAWRSRRAADVVKLLALSPGHELHREQVMATLWPNLPADAAAANLRKAVHYARRALGSADVLESRERWIGRKRKVCDPCSMNFRMEAVRASARAGDLARTRRHLAEAERIAGLWQGGPWIAAIWEARAELRRAEGQTAQANALLLEAAESFAGLRRPLDESRCRSAAALAG